MVLLHDLGASGMTLAPIVARWAATAPIAAFVALDGIEHLDAPPNGLSSPAMRDRDTPDPTVLDRAAQKLEVLLGRQLRRHGLDASRLVLVGFGYGGTLALHLLLGQGWGCAGILAFTGELVSPLPRIVRIDCKVRLIDREADTESGHAKLRDKVTLLNARGIDARGVLLSGSPFSDQAVRHGSAYLGELVATAQRSGSFRAVRERSHA